MNYRHQLFTAAAGGSKQRSGLRRIVCLAALLVCFFANVQAQVKIGDISLTSGSFSSVSVGFEGIITSGYVNYNESGNVLRLYEASIKAGLDINKEGLTIQLIGDCSIQTTANGVYLRTHVTPCAWMSAIISCKNACHARRIIFQNPKRYSTFVINIKNAF